MANYLAAPELRPSDNSSLSIAEKKPKAGEAGQGRESSSSDTSCRPVPETPALAGNFHRPRSLARWAQSYPPLRKESELFQWVGSLANEGTWESEGRFTLEKDKAWAKLSAYQLPFPEAWVLKLVQAAVTSAIPELRVKQRGSETTFHFVGQTSWNEERLTEALFSTDSVIDQSLVPLAVAIRYLAAGAERLLALHYPDGSTQVWDGEAFHTETSPYPTEHFALTVFSAKKDGLRWLSPPALAAGESASVGKVLANFAYPSPLPILVDGRRINGFSSDPDGGASSTTAPFALLPFKAELQLPEFRFWRDWEWKPELEEISLEVGGELEELRGESLSCGMLACLTACIKEVPDPPRFDSQPNFIKWVRDGVVVRAEPIKALGAVGITVLISAEGLRTDLSGLSLAEDHMMVARRKQAKSRVRAKLYELLDKDTHVGVSIRMKGRVHKAAMVALAGLGLIQPIFLGMAGVAAAQYASDKLRVRQREFQVQDDFVRLCKKF